jgi:hypothetical protein
MTVSLFGDSFLLLRNNKIPNNSYHGDRERDVVGKQDKLKTPMGVSLFIRSLNLRHQNIIIGIIKRISSGNTDSEQEFEICFLFVFLHLEKKKEFSSDRRRQFSSEQVYQQNRQDRQSGVSNVLPEIHHVYQEEGEDSSWNSSTKEYGKTRDVSSRESRFFKD